MDWREFISERTPTDSWGPFTFRDGASTDALTRLEAEFHFPIPDQLRELLLQTDGVFDRDNCPFIDDVAEIAAMNRLARSETYNCFMPLDSLFFFSNVYGNGDFLGYGIRRDNWSHPGIFRWDHEDDSRNWEAPDLQTWIEWLFAEKIET